MTTATDYRAIFDPSEHTLTHHEWCPVCEMRGATTLAKDRYDFDCYPAKCVICGLRWFTFRMNKKAYADFYQSGAYRRLVSAYHGREMGGCEPEYANDVGWFIGKDITCSHLDIGGAPRGIWFDQGKKDSTVIDPALDGQTAETFDPAGRTWDLITVCQTVDHLLEPGAVFKKLAGCLAPNGVLFFDAVDFDATKEYKIDHPCNFNMRSATMLAHVAGLRIDKMERSGNHLRFLCRHW